MENIILIGYMGCGKTTTGKNLARTCNMQFMDTDEEIEKQQGKAISEIFAQQGEMAFRDMETAFLSKLLQEQAQSLVISTGGGMPLRGENKELLQKLGSVIYLKASPNIIYERVKGDTKRPLLQCDNPLKKIEEMQAHREIHYEKAAKHVICVDELRQADAAELIKKLLGKK